MKHFNKYSTKKKHIFTKEGSSGMNSYSYLSLNFLTAKALT